MLRRAGFFFFCITFPLLFFFSISINIFFNFSACCAHCASPSRGRQRASPAAALRPRIPWGPAFPPRSGRLQGAPDRCSPTPRGPGSGEGRLRGSRAVKPPPQLLPEPGLQLLPAGGRLSGAHRGALGLGLRWPLALRCLRSAPARPREPPRTC